MPNDLAVNMLLTHPASNQLGKLRPKVEYENSFLSGSRCWSSGRLICRTCFQTTVHDRQDSSPAAQAAASCFCTAESRCSHASLERKRKLPLSQRQLETPNYITLQAGQKSRKSWVFYCKFGPASVHPRFPPPCGTKTACPCQVHRSPTPAQYRASDHAIERATRADSALPAWVSCDNVKSRPTPTHSSCTRPA